LHCHHQPQPTGAASSPWRPQRSKHATLALPSKMLQRYCRIPRAVLSDPAQRQAYSAAGQYLQQARNPLLGRREDAATGLRIAWRTHESKSREITWTSAPGKLDSRCRRLLRTRALQRGGCIMCSMPLTVCIVRRSLDRAQYNIHPTPSRAGGRGLSRRLAWSS